MKNKRVALFLLLIAAVAIFGIALGQVVPYLMERKTALDRKNDLISAAVTEREPAPAAATPAPTPVPEEEKLSEFREMTVLEEYPPISVDFEQVGYKDQVIGWIYMADSPINYPIAQGRDNYQYEEHSLDGVWCYEGTIFLDYRNNNRFEDFGSIIYGHDMQFGHMFGCLDKYKEQAYFDTHRFMYLFTPEATYKVEVMYGFITKSDSFVYDLSYKPEWREKVLAAAAEGTTFESGIEGDIRDHYVLLSTCTYEFEGARYVVVGKLRRILD